MNWIVDMNFSCTLYLHYKCNTIALSVGTCSRQSEARICNGNTAEHWHYVIIYYVINYVCILQGYQLDYNITFIRILHQPPVQHITYTVHEVQVLVQYSTCFWKIGKSLLHNNLLHNSQRTTADHTIIIRWTIVRTSIPGNDTRTSSVAIR